MTAFQNSTIEITVTNNETGEVVRKFPSPILGPKDLDDPSLYDIDICLMPSSHKKGSV
jgi:hypothetical protein